MSAQCPSCARLDRSYSVAADTRADDPRPYDVYLAWFGPGLLKVGITTAEREGARLLEQAALSYALLARGPLMAARRAEAVLGAALGVPDRVRTRRSAPPASRHRPRNGGPPSCRRCTSGRGRRRVAESLARLPCVPVHHDAAFHLDRARPPFGLVRLAPRRAVVGTVEATAGPDVYLRATDGRTLLLDARRLAGWTAVAADPGGPTTAEVCVPAPVAAARSRCSERPSRTARPRARGPVAGRGRRQGLGVDWRRGQSSEARPVMPTARASTATECAKNSSRTSTA
ncbi:DUF2797 domain-containing protein [Streptomyces sp. M19]